MGNRITFEAAGDQIWYCCFLMNVSYQDSIPAIIVGIEDDLYRNILLEETDILQMTHPDYLSFFLVKVNLIKLEPFITMEMELHLGPVNRFAQ